MGSAGDNGLLASQLSLTDVAGLLKGHDFWHIAENQRFGLSALRFSDGPNGVRGEDWVNGAPSSAIPCATALGASFDPDLVYRAAELLAAESHRKGAHVLLAPTMNTHRYPLCGRNFESFSEDPYLTGIIAAAYVRGLQDNGIAACPKHFLANEAENGRRWSDSVIEERALREIYLESFGMVVKNSQPRALMTAYNSLNGSFCSESESLMTILRNEWGFNGVTVSDWFGTYSSVPALKAGLDVEMPGPSKFRDEGLLKRAIKSKQVSSDQLTASAARIIELMKWAQTVGPPGSAPPLKKAEKEYVDDPAKRLFLREAARATMVLLKNESQTLPLSSKTSSHRNVACGEHATKPALFGGGSAALKIPETVTPWDAIRQPFPGAVLSLGVGTDRLVKMPQAGALEVGPITLQWYNGNMSILEKRFSSENINDTLYMLVEEAPEGLVDRSDFCATMSFALTPSASGEYNLSICGPGSAQCIINGRVVFEVKRDLGVSTEDFLFEEVEARERAGPAAVSGQRCPVRVPGDKLVLQAQSRECQPRILHPRLPRRTCTGLGR